MQFIWMHYTLLFNALYLIVNCLICPCKSNGYFGTPPSETRPERHCQTALFLQ